MTYSSFPKGSEWRKWDLHIHAPSEYTCSKNDQFEGGSLEEKQDKFIEEVQNLKDIAVLGVTDYFSLDGYKYVWSQKEKLTNVSLLLPNVEFRIDPTTSKNRKINLHLIANPQFITVEDLERFIHKFEFGHDRLTCRKADLIKLGHSMDANLSDEGAFAKGLNQFSIGYDQFFITLKSCSDEFKRNVIVGVSNSNNDGASGIKDLPALRDIIYRGVDFILSPRISDKEYFTGQGVDSLEEIVKKYGTLKPCLHGSDYHGSKDGSTLCVPDLDRFCWIKSDPTFEGLKQVLYEPIERIFIGADKPDTKLVYQVIDKVKFQDPDFMSHEIEINQNLTTIIGGKSTGKSILLKNIAKSVDGKEYRDRLATAGLPDPKPIKGMEVIWKDGQISALDSDTNPNKRIIYIPQSYLNRVVDSDESNKDIDEIIRDVLLQDKGFEAWYDKLISGEKEINSKIEAGIKILFENVSIYNQNDSGLKKIGDATGISEQIKQITTEIRSLQTTLDLTPEEITKFNSVSLDIKIGKETIQQYEGDLILLERLKKELVQVVGFSYYSFNNPNVSEKISTLYNTKIEEYSLNWKHSVSQEIVELSKQLEILKSDISSKTSSIKKLQVKMDGQNTIKQKYKQLEEEQKKQQLIEAYQNRISQAKKGIEETITELSRLTSEYYSMYLEAKDNLPNSDLDEELKFDILTTFSQNQFNTTFIKPYFDGRSIYKPEFDYLTKLEFVSKESFKDDIAKILKATLAAELPTRNEIKSKEIVTAVLKNWFAHKYLVEYQGDQIVEMSPGKRSFVLLRLLVDLDSSKCPILIDQPEDDLDNRSIYNQVVQFLRKRKSDRQIIIATHNPNLVLGADSEQIIVANQEGKGSKNKSSKFEYVSGSIEYAKKDDPKIVEILYKRGIQEHVCDILEGGEEAFTKRKNKYNFV